MRISRSVDERFRNAFPENLDAFHTAPDSLSDDLTTRIALFGLERITQGYECSDVRSAASTIKEVGRAYFCGFLGGREGPPQGSGVEIRSGILARVLWVEGDDVGFGRH